MISIGLSYWRRNIIVLLLVFWRLGAEAHVGSPNVFFEGVAGPYRTHVIVTPAEVIPGLAEISIRVDNGEPTQVTALPMKWNSGRNGAPPPDIARPVRGETNLFTAQLWFMEHGAHSIEIAIKGKEGQGTIIVPVNAGASRVLTMPKSLGTILAVLGLLLLALLLSIIGAAVRESVLDPGNPIPTRRRWWARAIMASATGLLVFLLWGGNRWWKAEAAEYKSNRLSHPLTVRASVQPIDGRRVLRLELPDFEGPTAPLVPDHGKLMHLFMAREPSMDAFAHLHPIKLDKKTFSTPLPDLPEGRYRFYADITYETGWSDTLTNQVDLPAKIPVSASPAKPASNSAITTDEDDAWCVDASGRAVGGEYSFTNGCTVRFIGPETIEANKSLDLKFEVRDREARPISPEPYLGMKGHLVILRRDGTVFTHLHPGGSASMAAMQLSALRAEGKLPLRAAFGKEDPVCELPRPTANDVAWLNGVAQDEGTVTFPYAFPREGQYRIWLQIRLKERVETAAFDVDVKSAGSRRTGGVFAVR